MINKLYEQIKKTIKENYKLLIFFFIMVCVLSIRFPFYIEAPGGIIAVDERIEIEEKNEASGSFNLAYVSEIKATIPTLTYALINKDWKIIKKEEVVYANETMEDANYRNHLLLKEANNNAIIVAYKKANKEIIISNEHLYVIYIDESAQTNLKIGDEILSVEGARINTKEQLDEIMIKQKSNTDIKLKVKRDNHEVDCSGYIQKLNGKNIIGVALSKTSDISTDPKIDLEFKSSESGPSGGLILALAIYNSLIDEDITNGKKIVGTGTINLDGSVGPIGGVEYKIKGAVKEHADVFLVPAGTNYDEASEVIKNNNYNINLVAVTSFEDALDKLKNI